MQMNNRIHGGGGVEKAINFGGFGSVAFGTIGSSAVGERRVIGIDVEGCRHHIGAGRRRGVDGGIITQRIGASKRSQAASTAERRSRPPLG